MDNWKHIRLELAQTRDFPGGSVSRSYLIRLPLSESGRVDRAAFEKSPYRATVRRYWSTEPDEGGHVLEAGDRWAMRCDGKPSRILDLAEHSLRIGNEVSVIEPDGTVLPFTVASIR